MDSKKENSNGKRFIYLLIGPKGSGKSFIGNLMDEAFGIKFVRVEDWAKKVKKGRSVTNDSYLKEVFQTIENGIRHEIIETEKLVFESTGLTIYFDQMLQSLKRDFLVTTVGIKAENDLCLKRVKRRDQSIHISLSHDMLISVNRKVRDRNLATDHILVNENKTISQLVGELNQILGPL